MQLTSKFALLRYRGTFFFIADDAWKTVNTSQILTLLSRVEHLMWDYLQVLQLFKEIDISSTPPRSSQHYQD